MHYPITSRRKVLAHIEEGMSKREAARLFKISPQTLYNWLSRKDLHLALAKTRHRKSKQWLAPILFEGSCKGTTVL
ncbi:MAG TPA: IS630 transposase-related protein [Alphaproteobacteria bacterium]|nr:helix-turn-helix domain-containing protein [Alphaproteobacteria bacterium]USO05110.1 MAG: helix-turn-helix domain-containing protein [Rhodospirillales bacterium]HOO81513.1 IS630 transposase-related protein [Alphaproteobacteria bacterium]